MTLILIILGSVVVDVILLSVFYNFIHYVTSAFYGWLWTRETKCSDLVISEFDVKIARDDSTLGDIEMVEHQETDDEKVESQVAKREETDSEVLGDNSGPQKVSSETTNTKSGRGISNVVAVSMAVISLLLLIFLAGHVCGSNRLSPWRELLVIQFLTIIINFVLLRFQFMLLTQNNNSYVIHSKELADTSSPVPQGDFVSILRNDLKRIDKSLPIDENA